MKVIDGGKSCWIFEGVAGFGHAEDEEDADYLYFGAGYGVA
jgi:hypothetical protein